MRDLIISMLPGSQVMVMVTLILKMIMTILIVSGSPNPCMQVGWGTWLMMIEMDLMMILMVKAVAKKCISFSLM